MKQIILTDLHGCYDEACRLLEKAKYDQSVDIILGVSDAVDKGPHSGKLVKMLASLPRVRNICGNHEKKFLRFVKAYRKDEAKAMERKNAKQMEETLLQLTAKELNWLEAASLWEAVDGMSAIVVHAGIEPALKNLPDKTLKGKDADSFSPLWFCRYVKNGRMVPLGKEDKDCQFWADVYDGRFGFVFYGHQPFFQNNPKENQHSVGLDLGGVMGGKLVAAIVEEGNVRFESVDSKAYCNKHEVYPE